MGRKPQALDSRNQELVAAFYAMPKKNLRILGLQFKISKQRVQQILSREGVDSSSAAKDVYENHTCRTCGRDTNQLKRATRTWCLACYQYSRNTKKRKNLTIRSITYPTHCENCHKDISQDKGKRYRGMCSKCYRRQMKFWNKKNEGA